MCGIAGLVSRLEPPSAERTSAMVNTLTHRGPDSSGTFVEGPLGFGMRRLSIIDLDNGHQPIANEDGKLQIVFNGEIYNYLDLRRLLVSRGHIFSTNSDTEVILHLYEEFGDSCVSHLRGMFAFAIWELSSERLFLARDRFGIKPLHYSFENGTFGFASEVRALTSQGFGASLDQASVVQYFDSLYAHDDKTLQSGIKKLLPGHTLSYENGRIDIKCYYELPLCSSTVPVSELVCLNRLRDSLEDSVKKHLISDVPVGAFLSGGIDSGLVAGMMRKLTDSPVKTFTIGYDQTGSTFDERVQAARIAKHLGTDHYELVLTPEKVRDDLPRIFASLDQPIGDASVIPNFLLSEFASKHVKVALSGLGGDEIFGGYERYLAMNLTAAFPKTMRCLSSAFVRSLISRLPDSKRGYHFPERIKRLSEAASLTTENRYFSLISKLGSSYCKELFSRDFMSRLESTPCLNSYQQTWDKVKDQSGVHRFLAFDCMTYLPDDLLALSDRTSMAHGLELRVPFVDHQLIASAWEIPEKFKIKGLTKKYLLKKLAEEYLPREVIYLKKRGFSVPLSIWFRGPLKEYLCETLSADRLRGLGIFNQEKISQLISEHLSGYRNHDEKLFALIAFVEWERGHKARCRQYPNKLGSDSSELILKQAA